MIWLKLLDGLLLIVMWSLIFYGFWVALRAK